DSLGNPRLLKIIAGALSGSHVKLIDLEIVSRYQLHVGAKLYRRHLARGGFDTHRLKTQTEMQFAGTPIVVESVGQIALLLHFKQYRARANCMHCTGVDEYHVSLCQRNPIQQSL